MPYTYKEEDNKAVFTLTIPKEKVEEGMQKAAEQLSKETKIPGFRPGKASYAAVIKRHGEATVLDMAAEPLIREAFVNALAEEKIQTIGQPHFHAEKLAPGNEMIITAEVALYPKVQKLADPTKIKIENKAVEISDEAVKEAAKSLAEMQAKEIRAEKGHKTSIGDKIISELTLKQGGVVIEGGEPSPLVIYTDQNNYIPGFVDSVLGAQEGETKEFELTFPEDYYASHLAGKKTTFIVEVKEVFTRELPEINDEFAKNLGMKDKSELFDRLKENLAAEQNAEELRRQETEMLNKLTEKSTFDTIPDLLVNQEVERMIQELQQNVAQSGGVFEDYLQQIGKSLAEIKLDFTPNALKRIQATLYIATYAKEHGIEVPEEEMKEFMENARQQFGDRAEEYIDNPRYQAFAQERLLHKVTLQKLREIMVN